MTGGGGGRGQQRGTGAPRAAGSGNSFSISGGRIPAAAAARRPGRLSNNASSACRPAAASPSPLQRRLLAAPAPAYVWRRNVCGPSHALRVSPCGLLLGRWIGLRRRRLFFVCSLRASRLRSALPRGVRGILIGGPALPAAPSSRPHASSCRRSSVRVRP